jgi:GrpB-like predicted nucleotidyltransferase (UPF0157 family)
MKTNRDLNKMTSGELGQLFSVEIQDYTEKWAALYQEEKQSLISSLQPSDIVKIDHIGSTAIPGLKAKPTIDILLQVSGQTDLQELMEHLKSLGYQLNQRPDKPPPHMTFVKGYSPEGFTGQAYHIHVRYQGDWDEIRFRDYLLRHREAAKEYEALKLKLAGRYTHDRESYTEAKKDFIEKIHRLMRK